LLYEVKVHLLPTLPTLPIPFLGNMSINWRQAEAKSFSFEFQKVATLREDVQINRISGLPGTLTWRHLTSLVLAAPQSPSRDLRHQGMLYIRGLNSKNNTEPAATKLLNRFPWLE